VGLRALRSVLLLSTLFLVGCAAAQVTIAPGSSRVMTGTRPPEGPYEQLGAITATHGGGCGLYGARGNLVRAKIGSRSLPRPSYAAGTR
jgi:hypothetical protein